jgi:hypothetical protein
MIIVGAAAGATILIVIAVIVCIAVGKHKRATAADKTAEIVSKVEKLAEESDGEDPREELYEEGEEVEPQAAVKVVITYDEAVEVSSDGDLNVDISWSGSAWQRSRWQMTATERWGVMYYDDGHTWVETYTDNGSSYSISNESYNGTGSFYIQDGKLHWYNDQTGEETLFLRAQY